MATWIGITYVNKIKMYLFIFIMCINCVISNYTFYQITAFSTRERERLYNIQESYEYAYFLNGVTNEASTSMDVVVDSCCTDEFEEVLFDYEIEFSSVTNHVPYSARYVNNLLQKKVLETFPYWNDILKWVEIQVKGNTALTKTVIAKTYEHRDVFVLKLSSERTDKKMSVFIVAGEEGRDWLSSTLLLNYINRLLKSMSSPQSLLNYFDIYFVPILNPDGFVYSKTKDRMWAKNRKVIRPTQTCEKFANAVGVNIDRNWFNEIPDSKYACNSIYHGNKALSEEETQGLSYILNSIALKLLAFINLRGFGNLITLPYASDKMSANNDIVKEVMNHASAVLKEQYNKSYPVGTTANYFYNSTGNMPDWVKRKLNIPIVFTVYMQQNNFLPEESHILPLTDQLEELLNISLIISKKIYGSLYNTQRKISSFSIVIIMSYIIMCICSKVLMNKTINILLSTY